MTIQKAPFGRTGHESTRVLFGAAALGAASQAEADRTFDVIVEAGINHIDVAASYGDAEDRIRPWLARAPGSSSWPPRAANAPRPKPARSSSVRLERMGVDHVDLWQLHNLVDPIEWDMALSPGGALEAAIAARDEGLIRFIGVTGHGLQVAATHRRSLERFDFDSVLLPYNYITVQDPYYDGKLRRARGYLHGTERRRTNHKVDRRRPLGRPSAHPGAMVRTLREPGRHRPGGLVGVGPARGVPEQCVGHGFAAAGPRRRRPAFRRGHRTRKCSH